MKIFTCLCGNRLFFENSLCLACRREVGWCPACRHLTALLPEGDRGYHCSHSGCESPLTKCYNYAIENVCNRCIVLDANGQPPEPLCDYCRYNETIPDLSISGNREKWYRLEVAKRRALYDLDLLGLPYGKSCEGFDPPLAFAFKADALPPEQIWRTLDDTERVYTGHSNGKITINIREADDVEREKLRVELNEARRTLISHFRHELGHYYWDLLVRDQREEHFKRVFGDHERLPYAAAQAHYYQHGPIPDWPERFISAYASMHPWEDFAEIFAGYLNVISIVDTAENMGFGRGAKAEPRIFESLVADYQRLGTVLNEMNRSIGLTDLVPEVFSQPVIEKMHFIHHLIGECATRPVNIRAQQGYIQ